MGSSTNKTVETDSDVAAFVAGLGDDQQRADSSALIDLMQAASGHAPKLWGPSIIGFGSVHYRYESGREGDTMRVGFSPRKGKFALYGLAGQFDALERLGKHATGKECIYVKRLSDIDPSVLREMIAGTFAGKTA